MPPRSRPTTSPTAELGWIAELRSGARGGLEAIYAHYFTSLWAFATRTVGRDVAEDVVHDVFLALWRRRESLAPDVALGPYLFAAVRRRCIDLARHDRVVADAAVTFDPSALPGAGERSASPDAGAELAELVSAMASALNALPERSRTLITLRWAEGMTYDQIATTMGMSLEAAKKQGRRLQRLLAPLLTRFRDP